MYFDIVRYIPREDNIIFTTFDVSSHILELFLDSLTVGRTELRRQGALETGPDMMGCMLLYREHLDSCWSNLDDAFSNPRDQHTPLLGPLGATNWRYASKGPP